MSRNQRQADVAEGAGIKESTYANAESNNHKTIRMERVVAIARHHQLDQAATAALVAAWEALPASKYNDNNRPSWERRRAFRSKAAAHDAIKLALLEVTTLLVTSSVDPGTLCSCPEVNMFGDEPDQDSAPANCELCNALRLLGLSGWTTQDDVIARLAAVQEGLTG